MDPLNVFPRRRALALVAPFALGLLAAPPTHAQRAPKDVGVVIIAHGGGPGWDARVDTLAAEVRQRGNVAGPVAVSFLMGPGAATHRFQNVVDSLSKQGAKRVVVVPLLMSSHSGHYEQIRYLGRAVDTLDGEMMHHLQMSGITRAAASVPVVVTPALDDAPQLARVVTDRALAIAQDAKTRAVFIFGHGPNSAEDYADWMIRLRKVADTVRTRGGFASVIVELVRDDAPDAVRAEAVTRSRELIDLQYRATGKTVAVVPLLVSSGAVMTRKLPADLEGLPIEYGKDPLLPHPAVAEWVESRVADALTQQPPKPAAATPRPKPTMPAHGHP